MKNFILLSVLFSLFSAGEAPRKLSQFLKVNEFLKAEIGTIKSPEKIEQYIKKIETAAYRNQEWFSEYQKLSEPGTPLPFHENLGLTPQEYKSYVSLWKQREFVPVEQVSLRLEQTSGEQWMIRCSGSGFPISSLRYDKKNDELQSPNGVMTQIADIKTSADNILGAWSGHEWKYETETTISKTKENFAIGMKANKKHGYLIYRIQEISYTGKLLYDKKIVLRFPNIL